MAGRLLLSLFALVFACGCPSETTVDSGVSEPDAEQQSRGVIGVSLLTFENPFFKVVGDNIREEAQKHGYEAVILSCDEDAARQFQQVEDFIVQKVSAIVLSPKETRSIVPAVQKANKAGIPVFTVDIPCDEPGVEIVSQVTTDNFGGGELAAKGMIEAIGSGKVAILHYQTAESCRLRVAGFRKEIDAYNATADQPIEIVAEYEGGAKKDMSRSAAADALQATPDLRGIFAINDPSALGAVAAIEEAGRLGQVTIIGFDGQPDGKQAILEGKIYADPIQYPDRLGQQVTQCIVDHFKGKEVPERILIPTTLYTQAEARNDPELQ